MYFLNKQIKTFCDIPIDFTYRLHTIQVLGIFRKWWDRFRNEYATCICKITAVYSSNPLRTLQSLALLDSFHQVIDYLLCPKSPDALVLFSTLNTREKAPFHCLCSIHCKTSLSCATLGRKYWFKVLGIIETNTSDSDVCLWIAKRLHVWPESIGETSPVACFALV